MKIFFFIPFFIRELNYRPSMDFHTWLKQRRLIQGCAFWGLRWYFSPFWVQNPPQKFWRHEKAFTSQTGKIFKVSYYRNYCITHTRLTALFPGLQQPNFAQRQRPPCSQPVGGPICAQQIQHGRRPPFWKKNIKSSYLSICLTDFDEIWPGDARWPLTADWLLKFRIFESPRWWQAPSWNHKNREKLYLHNSWTDVYKIWYDDAKWAS